MDMEKFLTLIFAVIASAGAAIMEASAVRNMSLYGIFLGALLSVVGLAGIAVLWYRKRKATPKDLRPRLKALESKWWEHPEQQYDLPYWFVLAQGIFVEFQYSHISIQTLFLIPLYLFAVWLVSQKIRESYTLTLWTSLFVFYTCLLSIPFATASLSRPEFLSQTFSIDVTTSRRLTILLTIYIQAAFVLSSAMLMSHSWRLGLLRRNKVDGKSLSSLIEEVIRSKHGDMELETIEAICLDIPRLVSLFPQGNHSSVVALGWSIIGRGLDFLGDRQAKANVVQSTYFKSCKEARNKSLHAQYKPTFRDSLDTLRVIRDLLQSLKVLRAET
jgi:hypothetical protein